MAYKAIPRQLTDEDKTFIKLIESGVKRSPAFRQAYPNHPKVVQFNRAEPGSPDYNAARLGVTQASKDKLQAQYMQRAVQTFEDSMEKFSELSLDTAIELVRGARSEKVRADLAIEGIRHKVGTPTAKIAVQQEAKVVLTFGNPPSAVAPSSGVTEGEADGDRLFVPNAQDENDHS